MNEKTVVFDKEIYSKQVIEDAIVQYKNIAKIAIQENITGFLCTFSCCKYETIETIQEFSNYLIDVMNSKG